MSNKYGTYWLGINYMEDTNDKQHESITLVHLFTTSDYFLKTLLIQWYVVQDEENIKSLDLKTHVLKAQVFNI